MPPAATGWLALAGPAPRRNLKTVLDRVCEDHEPVVITRRSGGNVVVLSEEDFSALEETAYLLRTPANARRLLEAVARDRGGAPGRPLDEVMEELEISEDEGATG